MNNGNRFSGLAIVEDLPDGAHDELQVPLAYTTADGKWTITVPAGFVTDYASIPQVFWSVLPERGRYNRAAIVHDWLYETHPIDPRTGKPVTRGVADAILREAMENLDVRADQRFTIWLGVRVGGWRYWKTPESSKERT